MSRYIHSIVIPVTLIIASATGCIQSKNSEAKKGGITLATTTSTENSGLLAHINPDFEKKTGIKVKVIPQGTGAAIQTAKDGNADVILVHARAKEDEFVAEGYGVNRRDVMYNDFVIIGPKDDPAGIRGMEDIAAALKKLAEAQYQDKAFISRGDNSGTHFKEQELWTVSGVPLEKKTTTFQKNGKDIDVTMQYPQGKWYLDIGQGMGNTINVATEKRAYTLSDRGTFYAYSLGDSSKTDLEILVEGDARLANPYGIIAVNKDKHPRTNFDGAMKYIEWITSPEVQKMIGEYKKGGKQLFHPNDNIVH